jgi:choline dehydrogenase-like flavoprotein
MAVGQTYDFVIVGSGAGGGPLAANLALAGHKVLLIEAGGNKINDNYSVPAFHGLSTEDPLFSWEFYVKHYSDDQRPERDPKYHRKDPARLPGAPGIFYPRATGLGGCTTHHAMITVYPHNSDWDAIANLVGDDSWRAENMRKYFDRLEHAQYRDGSVLLELLQPERFFGDFLRRLTGSEHGEGARGPRGAGWLSVTQADPLLLRRDSQLLKIVKTAFATALTHRLQPMPGLDPNHPSVAMNNLEGINIIPISVNNGRRTGARERVLETQQILRDLTDQGEEAGQLEVVTDTFATKVVFADDDPTHAIGVQCVPGEALYAARHHTRTAGQPGDPITYYATKEVILCGGAFNTPQLLMLSGIGPANVLREKGIAPVRIDLRGVGANLQDRYEVGVVARMKEPFTLLEHATFRGRQNPTDPDPDPVYTEWREHRKGIYATNGSVLGIIMRSSTQASSAPPDLYIFGVPGPFRGYEIGYSEKAVRSEPKDYFTWAVLKGHTDNTSGYVTLKTADPFDTPEIHFKYFEESSQSDKNDVQSVVDGVKFAQAIYAQLDKAGMLAEYLAPAQGEDLEKFVRDNAWGHHASCTCKIGKEDDEWAVLDKDFQVRGAKNLRVVDASVFPRIPGLFILSAVYMISEKASDVIIEKYR